jgi:uncharacterized protein YbbK (DUF523 family)
VVVAVSRCLLGERVRYDGGDKALPWLRSVPSTLLRVIPICPEVDAGLGVPREPIELRTAADGRVSVACVVTGRDVTAALEGTLPSYRALFERSRPDGFVLKRRSPSCALGSAPIDGQGAHDGFFAAWVATRYPACPRIDETGLGDPGMRRRFFEGLRRVRRAWGEGTASVEALERWLATCAANDASRSAVKPAPPA